MAKSSLVLCIVLLATSGCHWGVLTVRHQEQVCPTDIRKRHWWLWGEDAIFHCPCGADGAYHGHKPTCWREWQAPTTVWRDEHCGPPVALATSDETWIPASTPVAPTAIEQQPSSKFQEIAPPLPNDSVPDNTDTNELPAFDVRPEPLPVLSPQTNRKGPKPLFTRVNTAHLTRPSAVAASATMQPADQPDTKQRHAEVQHATRSIFEKTTKKRPPSAGIEMVR